MSKTLTEWHFYLTKRVSFTEKVIVFTDGLNQLEFNQSGSNYDATPRNLELIGEAATHIPEAVRINFSKIPWWQLIATCNHLIHGYLGIDNDTVGSIIKADVPVLLNELQWIQKQKTQ